MEVFLKFINRNLYMPLLKFSGIIDELRQIFMRNV